MVSRPYMNWKGDIEDNWKTFIEDFKRYVKTNDLNKETDETKKALLFELMGKEGLQIYTSLKVCEPISYNGLSDLFEDYCCPNKKIIQTRYLFNSCFQKTEQTGDLFATELRFLAKNCNFGQMGETLICDRFVCGILDDKAREKMFLIKNLQLQDAIEICESQLNMINRIRLPNNEDIANELQENGQAFNICPLPNTLKIKSFDKSCQTSHQGFDQALPCIVCGKIGCLPVCCYAGHLPNSFEDKEENDSKLEKETDFTIEYNATGPTTSEDTQNSRSKPRKQIYSRDFLLGFKYEPISLQRPEELPNVEDLIMEKPRGKKFRSRRQSSPDVSDYVTKFGQQVKPMRYDPQKMKLSKGQFGESNVTLGPSRMKTRKTGSGSKTTKSVSGSYSNNQREASNYDPESIPCTSTPTVLNKFFALGNATHDSYALQRFGSRHSAPVITESIMEKKTESIVKEFLHLVSLNEAMECFYEIKAPPCLVHMFPQIAMSLALEKSGTDRHNIARLMNYFLKNKKITSEQYLKGFAEVLEIAADLELDLPKVWSCVAELFGPVLHCNDNNIDLTSFISLSQPLLDLNKAGIFVAEVLSNLIKNMPLDAVLEKWQSANLHWALFMPFASSSSIAALLDKYNLQAFSLEGNGSTTMPLSNLTVAEIRKQLDLKKSANDIFDWVEANFDAEKQSTSQFIRSLTKALCQEAIEQAGGATVEVNEKVIKSRLLIFKKFIDDEEKELQAVYALQSLYIQLEQPPNILKSLFNLLYDEDVISETAFLRWESESNEEKGRGVALLSVKPFLTWLRTTEVESDD